jgi:hypothetical protein
MRNFGAVELFIIFFVVAICVSVVVGIFYCLTLQKALNRCAPQNRAMSPGLVWLFLIPVFNLIWHFFIVINLAKSLHAEFVMRNLAEEQSPGQGIGLATCILNAVGIFIGFIPFVGWVIGVAGFVCWIIYWIKIAGYSDKIAMPYTAPAPPAGAPPAA